MAKYETKTKETKASVQDFLNQVEDEQKRNDCFELLKLMGQITKQEPKMWGPSIVGFGSYHYKYATGHEGDSPLMGFSPRKQNIALYISIDYEERYPKLMHKLGKYSTGKACLYIKRLSDVDRGVLKELMTEGLKTTKKHI
jgi:hypothetical protein